MKGRIDYIDGLRAVAVLSVVVHHAAKYDQDLPVGPLQHALVEGAHGVDLFFVISGFVLAYPTLAKLHAQRGAAFDVVRYLAHRFVRILPPYYLAVGAGCVVLLALSTTHVLMPWGIMGQAIGPLDVVKQMVFIDLRPQFLNGSFWSLAVEFRWYFAFPLLLVLWTRSTRAFGLVALAFTSLSLFTRATSLDMGIMPAFMLGIVAADIEIRRLPVRRLAGLLAILCLCLALAFEPRQPYEFYARTQVGWQLTVFFAVVAAGAIPWLKRALSVKPLVAIGIVSYSIYLVHEPLVGIVLRNTAWGLGGAVAVGLAAGALFWLACERPFVAPALKQTLTRALEPRLARIAGWVGVPRSVTLARTTTVSAVPDQRSTPGASLVTLVRAGAPGATRQ